MQERNVVCADCGTERPGGMGDCPVCRVRAASASDQTPTRAAPAKGSTFASGARIAERYLVLAELGRGGFGVVVRAIDQRLGRSVAVKLIGEAVDASEEDRTRFERESLILASLDHPNIVPIYDAGIDQGRLYFAMKLVRGRSLGDRIRSGPIPEREALGIVHQLVSALEHAHSRGVLHRDLKPSNILEDEEGRIYLADFGVSTAGFLPRVTKRGTVMGTLDYLSPEALSGDVGEKSDLYSLGALLHEMLFGRPCFFAREPREMIKKICDETPPLLERPPVPLSAQLHSLLRRLLEKDPSKRPANAAAVQAEIEDIIRGVAASGAIAPSGGLAAALSEATRAVSSDLPGDPIDRLERSVEEIVRQTEASHPDINRILALLADFVAEGSLLADRVTAGAKGEGDDPILHAFSLSLLHLARDVERRLASLREALHDSTLLEGYVIRLQKSILVPVSGWIAEFEKGQRGEISGGEEFFVFDDSSFGPALSDGGDPIADLLGVDELRRHEAVLTVSGRGLETFLAGLRSRPEGERDRLLGALFEKADVVLLEGRGRSRSLFEAAIALASDRDLAERWSRLFELFRKPRDGYPEAAAIRPSLDLLAPEQRQVVLRCLLFHPAESHRQLALETLEPADFWEVIAHPGTPVRWLLEIWRALEPRVTRDFLKVFFVCIKDTLLRAGDAERIVAVVEMVKELYRVDSFHEDVFFKMLIDLDERVRVEARRHRLLVDFDAEYIERLRGFLAGGAKREQPIEGWGIVPLPIQRRLARGGHFLRHFVCHPIDIVALECLPHLLHLDNVGTYVEIYSINAKLLIEISKEKRLFQREESRFALVSNPKTPAYVVLKHLGFLRKDSLRKLSESHECNQLSRNYAIKMLGRGA